MMLLVDALLPALYMVYGLMKGKIKIGILPKERRDGLYFSPFSLICLV